jgi:hypothetical protein
MEKSYNNSTIGPAPLGIEPNIIDNHQHRWQMIAERIIIVLTFFFGKKKG